MGLTYSLTKVSGPLVEPVTLAEARKHLRLDDGLTAEDDLVQSWITAAREWAEDFTGRAFVSQQWDLRFNTAQTDWASDAVLEIPKPPLISIDGLYYRDDDGVEQPMGLADYAIDAYSTPARLYPAVTWPSPGEPVGGIRIRFTAGYPAGSPDTDAAANVPEVVALAIKVTLTAFHANRGADLTGLPAGAKALLNALQVHVVR